MFRMWVLSLGLFFFIAACEQEPRPVAGGDGDADGDMDGDVDGDGDSDYDTEDCDNLLEITVRDFDTRHPDMERADKGWGPVAGVLEPVLGADRKPIFADPMGTYQWVIDSVTGELKPNCWDSGPGTPQICWGRDQVPMFEGADSFYDWYHDTELNQRFDKILEMGEDPNQVGVYLYDSTAFFPLDPSEGWGITPTNDNPENRNFLFTTEIHLLFTYWSGQKFTFRGDDDLWIFVNNKIALDLGGMHLPFEATIDFDAKAEELGIAPGGSYNMDIFHAERHTTMSNFRIETNISCFVPVPIV